MPIYMSSFEMYDCSLRLQKAQQTICFGGIELAAHWRVGPELTDVGNTSRVRCGELGRILRQR
jgi:hypothetical protein